MSPSKFTHLTVVQRLLALVALAALIVTVIAVAGGDPAQSADAPQQEPVAQTHPAPYSQPPAAVVAASEAAFEDSFALLREPGGESIPATSVITDSALDVGGARQLTPASAARSAGEEGDPEAPEAAVWVAPRADGTQCLLAQLPEADGPAQTCASAERAIDGYFVMTQSRSATDTEIYGLLPDGVDSVDVALADGTTATLPVVSNAYLARFDQPTVSITWIDGDDVEQTLAAGTD